MKLILAFIFVFLFFSITLFAQPKLEIVGGDTYNWGKVTPQDSPLKTIIEIKNAGNEKLIISDVKPTCGCTTAPLTKSTLEPGETTTINVTLRINASNSAVRKTINISSNDPTLPITSLNLEAVVVQPLKLIPNNYFVFNDLKIGSESTATIQLQNNTENDVTILDYEVKPEDVRFNIRKNRVLKPGEKMELTAHVTPEKAGYFSMLLRIKTSAKEMPELTIQGSGKVPESILFNN